MNLIVVCSVIPPSRIPNGIGEYASNLARTLADQGHRVSLVCSDADIDRTLGVADFPKARGLKVYPFHPVWKIGLGIPSRPRVIPPDALKNCDAVVINSVLQGASLAAALQCIVARKPFVLLPHGALLPAALQQSPRKKKAYFSSIGRFIFQRASAIIATSQAEKGAMRSAARNTPVEMIPIGASAPLAPREGEQEELEKNCPKLKGKQVVACLSRVSREKGLDLLLDGWPMVVGKCPDAVLAVAVNGDPAALRTQARSLGIEDSVQFFENFSGPSKWPLFRRADVIVVPSRSESFGLVVTEALACGKPVVATQGAPWADLEEFHCGKWVPVRADAIGSALSDLLSLSVDERRSMGERGVQLVRDRYSWDQIAKRMGDFLASLDRRRDIS